MSDPRRLLLSVLWTFILIPICYSSSVLVTAQSGRNPSAQTGNAASGATSPSVITPATGNATTVSRPPHHLALLYGLLATTIVNAAAFVGFIFAPLHKCGCYPLLISFMVATAVGSLFAAAILVLIPEAFQLMSLTDGDRPTHWYMLRAISICIGAIVFFILEFLLRLMRTTLEVHSRDPRVLSRLSVRKRQSKLACVYDAPIPMSVPNHSDMEGDIGSPIISVNGLGTCGLDLSPQKSPDNGTQLTHDEDASIVYEKSRDTENDKPITCCTKNLCHRLAMLDPIVWMIVLGDGVHNFMDGVSIGAGFANDLRLGVSITLAVLCEELPHELGDIAVLLRSGLSVTMAILFNFSSACTAYLGFFMGLYLGDMPDATVYIFAVTGGFFLYISLADMLPELRKSEDQYMEAGRSVVPLFVIHLFGMIFGFGCVTAITMAGEYITI